MIYRYIFYFIPTNTLSNGYSLAGIYDTSGDVITIELRQFHEDEDPIV